MFSKSPETLLESRGIESLSPLILTPPPTPTGGIDMLEISTCSKIKTALQPDSNIKGFHSDVNNSCYTNECLRDDVKAALQQSEVTNFTALRTAENNFTGGEDRLSSFRLRTCERYVVFINYMTCN